MRLATKIKIKQKTNKKRKQMKLDRIRQISCSYLSTTAKLSPSRHLNINCKLSIELNILKVYVIHVETKKNETLRKILDYPSTRTRSR